MLTCNLLGYFINDCKESLMLFIRRLCMSKEHKGQAYKKLDICLFVVDFSINKKGLSNLKEHSCESILLITVKSRLKELKLIMMDGEFHNLEFFLFYIFDFNLNECIR
ncbi:hypothetical protein HZS_1204 [Henneguya salminicola]|nr:hypothetical protein HZS_1204 [Henneguya salminicola]